MSNIKNLLILFIFGLSSSAYPFVCTPAGSGEKHGIPCPAVSIGGPYIPELYGAHSAPALDARQLVAPNVGPVPKVEHRPAPGSTFGAGAEVEAAGRGGEEEEKTPEQWFEGLCKDEAKGLGDDITRDPGAALEARQLIAPHMRHKPLVDHRPAPGTVSGADLEQRSEGPYGWGEPGEWGDEFKEVGQCICIPRFLDPCKWIKQVDMAQPCIMDEGVLPTGVNAASTVAPNGIHHGPAVIKPVPSEVADAQGLPQPNA